MEPRERVLRMSKDAAKVAGYMEEVAAENAELRKENLELKDQIARLKKKLVAARDVLIDEVEFDEPHSWHAGEN